MIRTIVVGTIAGADALLAAARSTGIRMLRLLGEGYSLALFMLAKFAMPASFVAASLRKVLRFAILSPVFSVLFLAGGSVAFLVVAALSNPFLRPELEYAHQRSSAIMLYDVGKRWIGIIPPAAFGDWSDGRVMPADHAAAVLTVIPPVWKQCIIFLEDRELERVSGAIGVNPLALIRAGWQSTMGDKRRGASTLYMQVVRTLHGWTPHAGEERGALLYRKVAEIFGATTLASIIASGDGKVAERFIGMHLPLVVGSTGSQMGDPIHGVELAGQILFGASAADLTPEQQAILAAAVKYPVLLSPPGDEKSRLDAEVQWSKVKSRASRCLRSLPKAGEGAFDQSLARLEAMSAPTPHIDRELAALLPNDPAHAWRIAANPVRRAIYFAQHELRLALVELHEKVGGEWRGQLNAIQLTTSASANRRFVGDVERQLAQLQQQVRGLRQSLLPVNGSGKSAHVILACADEKGHLQRIYTSHHGLFLTRRSSAASVMKMVAAVALGQHDTPDAKYCAPANGRCKPGDARMSARTAFGKSNNAATQWALMSKTAPAQLVSLGADLMLPSFGDTPPSTALTRGLVDLSPAEMLRLAGVIGAGISGSYRDVGLPTTIANLEFAQSAKAERKPPRNAAVSADTIRKVFTLKIRQFVSSVLRATSESGGTLHRLASIREELRGELFAKTGTASVHGMTHQLHIAGSFMRQGMPWSFVMTVGTANPSEPLGVQLFAGQFAHLAAVAICR